MSVKRFHLHLVSDATGETVSAVARACIVQFSNVEPIHHLWWLVRSPRQVDRVIDGIDANPGLVLATLVESELRHRLEDACRQRRIPVISVLDPVMAGLSAYLNAEFSTEPGRQHLLDAEYFDRIDAMHFTLAHDDGQMLESLDSADIVLVGVSRTSKTPTCMYLANRGLKAANVPLVPNVPPPPELLAVRRPLVIGLTRDPKTLVGMRATRLRLMNRTDDGGYADPDQVRDEIIHSRRLFEQHGWPIIDVTRRSIEEAAATILQLYLERNKNAEVRL